MGHTGKIQAFDIFSNHNRKTIIRVESDITLQLPENTLDTIQYHINKIIKSKF